MIWALGSDDHNGLSCKNGSYPLLRTIAECLSAIEETTQKTVPVTYTVSADVSESTTVIGSNLVQQTSVQYHEAITPGSSVSYY
mgnify:CR=1 FL=1